MKKFVKWIGWNLVFGIFIIILGLYIMYKPGAMTTVLISMFGIVIIFIGFADVIQFYFDLKKRRVKNCKHLKFKIYDKTIEAVCEVCGKTFSETIKNKL